MDLIIPYPMDTRNVNRAVSVGNALIDVGMDMVEELDPVGRVVSGTVRAGERAGKAVASATQDALKYLFAGPITPAQLTRSRRSSRRRGSRYPRKRRYKRRYKKRYPRRKRSYSYRY